jgi:hypothetical protein
MATDYHWGNCMRRTIARLSDGLLSIVVPRTTATAGYEYRCTNSNCPGGRWKKQQRYCSGNCSAWYDTSQCVYVSSACAAT